MSEMDQGDTPAPHTPLPWYASGDGLRMMIRGADEKIVALRHRLGYEEHEANFQLIVRAVNSHYALVEALEAAQVFAEAVLEMHGPDHAGLNLSTLNKIDAALSAAKGET